MEDIVLNFLKSRPEKLCVLSTANSSGKSESSVVGYAIEDDLTLIFSTKPDTRKVSNLKENNSASFVTGWTFSEMNIQIDGTVSVITDGEEYKKLDEFFFSQNPQALKFKSPDTVFLKFTPTWIRYLDPTVHPPKMEEKILS